MSDTGNYNQAYDFGDVLEEIDLDMGPDSLSEIDGDIAGSGVSGEENLESRVPGWTDFSRRRKSPDQYSGQVGSYSMPGKSVEMVDVTPLERRTKVRDTPKELARVGLEKRLPLDVFEQKVETLADYCFSEGGYEMKVNGSVYVNGAADDSGCTYIDLKVKSSGDTDGKVEFYLAKGFNQRFKGTMLFIKEIARYIGSKLDVSDEELARKALTALPADYEEEDIYKAVFVFDDRQGEVKFSVKGETVPELEALGRLKVYGGGSSAEEEAAGGTGLLKDDGSVIFG